MSRLINKYKTYIYLLVFTEIISLVVILAVAGSHLVLSIKYEALKQQYHDYATMTNAAFSKAMVWKMDDSCNQQFSTSNKLHIMMEKLD
jgi:hypothetical protein